MTTEPLALLALLQFSDGLFPAGGFAHSFGLETYTQAGTVKDRAGLEAFLRAHLEGSSGPADAVAAASAARFAAHDDLAACQALDERLEAMKCVPEFRAASVQMGRQTARAAAALGGDPFIVRLAAGVEEGTMAGHHAMIFGAVAGRYGADAKTAAAAFLHSTMALLVNAALRLLPIGQIEGQQTLAALRPLMAGLAEAAGLATPDEMWSFAPGLELAGLRHADLDLRLFRS